MIRVRDVMEYLEIESPIEYACEWDNVGLMVGCADAEVKRIYVALDATEEVIEHAVECGSDMLITHHPLIFTSVSRVSGDDSVGRRIIRLVRNDIACCAYHTNFDISRMSDIVAARMGITVESPLERLMSNEDGEDSGIGFVGHIEDDGGISLMRFKDRIKEAFNLSHVKIFGKPDMIVRKVACCPGSGKSDMLNALRSGADVYVTGDIDHHTGIDALEDKMAVIDAGHYGLEHVFIDCIADALQENFRGVEVYKEGFAEPFWIG